MFRKGEDHAWGTVISSFSNQKETVCAPVLEWGSVQPQKNEEKKDLNDVTNIIQLVILTLIE